MESIILGLLIALGVFLSLVVYFIPYLIANTKRAKEKGIIFWLNLLVGWTGLVWLALVVWACTVENLKKSNANTNLLTDVETLREYHKLLEEGVISKEEFEIKKQSVINN